MAFSDGAKNNDLFWIWKQESVKMSVILAVPSPLLYICCPLDLWNYSIHQIINRADFLTWSFNSLSTLRPLIPIFTLVPGRQHCTRTHASLKRHHWGSDIDSKPVFNCSVCVALRIFGRKFQIFINTPFSCWGLFHLNSTTTSFLLQCFSPGNINILGFSGADGTEKQRHRAEKNIRSTSITHDEGAEQCSNKYFSFQTVKVYLSCP